MVTMSVLRISNNARPTSCVNAIGGGSGRPAPRRFNVAIAAVIDQKGEAGTTLLDRIGGESALEVCVNDFYVRLLEEPQLQPFFEGANLAKLQKHQFNFMRMAFTEIPEDMDVAGVITKAHGRLIDMGLDETHFDLVATNLVATLKDAGVGEVEIGEAVAIIGPLRNVFVHKA